MRKLTLGAMALAVGTMIGSTASHADLFGEIWLNEPNVSANLALFPTGLASGRDATFTSTAFNYQALVGEADTIGNFLGADAASLSPNIANSPVTNAVFRFTGNAIAPGGTASVTHDDGIILSTGINTTTGNLINRPLAQNTGTDTAPFVGAQAITLLYGECCGLPAVLISNLDNAPAVPEPASLALLGTALVGLVPVLRRRRKTG